MATSIPSRPLFLLSTALCLFASTTRYGMQNRNKGYVLFGTEAYDDHNLGAAKVVADEFVPFAAEEGEGEGEGEGGGEGGGGGGGGGEGEGEDEVGSIITKALECFNDKYIYSSCDEEYRLTQHGELNVPREYADEYCNGACAKETELVLECVEGILKHFRFHNRATCRDVRETIKAGCGYGNGHRRGDFNVAEHMRVDEEDNATKLSAASLVFATAVAVMVMGRNMWF